MISVIIEEVKYTVVKESYFNMTKPNGDKIRPRYSILQCKINGSLEEATYCLPHFQLSEDREVKGGGR